MSKINSNNVKKTTGAIAWMAGNSVTSNLLMLVLLIGGLLFAFNIKQELFPEFDLDMVSVTVVYPGASPEEIEQGICLAVEEAINSVDGIDDVVSTAKEGLAVINAELLLGADSQKAKDEIEQAIDRITSFPEDAEDPQVTVITRKRKALSVAIYGDLNDVVLRNLAEKVRDRFLQDKDISQIELSGAKKLEIAIEVPTAKLRAHQLTLEKIAQIIKASTIELPGGGIKTTSGEVLVRVNERRDNGREFSELPIINSPDGSEVKLGELAHISDGFEESDYDSTFNRLPAITLDVYRIGKETPIKVASAVKRIMKEMEENHELPPSCHLMVTSDFSAMFIDRMDLLLRNAALGLALVLILLGVFLEARLAFWVTMGIPISFLGAFLILPFFAISINMVSMFAFIVALGIVVDDAIVVGENIYQHLQEGMTPLDAARAGVKEVALPVTFSVLTNIVAFMSMFFVPGVMGKIFVVIPAVVVTVFAISLIECLFILPAHLSHKPQRRNSGLSVFIHSQQQAFSRWFKHLINDFFGPILLRVLQYRYLAIGIAFFVLLSTIGYVKSGRMGMVMFPKVESAYAVVTAILPYGSPIEKSEKVRDVLEASAEKVVAENGGKQLATGIQTQIGGSYAGVSGSHVVEVKIHLTDADVRPIGTREVVKKWRQQPFNIAGLDLVKFESDRGGPGHGASLSLELRHKDLTVLEAASSEFATMLRGVEGVIDVDDGFSPGKPQYDFSLLPTGKSLGLTALEVARQVRNSFYGSEVLRQQRGRNEVKVIVRLPKSERTSIYDIEECLIKIPNGKDVPLKEVVKVTRGRAYTSINRRAGSRTVTVSATVVPEKFTSLVKTKVFSEFIPKLKQDFPGLTAGVEGKQKDMANSMKSLALGFLFALFIIYILLAIPFNSYLQPAIIMISIPFGIVGATLGHLVMGYSLSIISMMGIIALSGVVVNDSLILIDFANKAVKEGMSSYDAIHLAAIRRFRPIMLTTLTTFGGLAPMIFETSRQARFLIPMAISLGYGILFATAISLLLVPCFFLVVEDLKSQLSRK